LPDVTADAENTVMMEVENDNEKEKTASSSSIDRSQNNQNPSAIPTQISKPQALSLRHLMYLSVAASGISLFHAVYPSSESGKIYCLCTQENRDEALRLLHHLEDTSANYFQEEHLRQIFVGYRNQSPYVKDYPKLTSHYNDYATDLVNLVSGENPQGDSYPPEIVPSPSKLVNPPNAKTYSQSLSSSHPPTAKRHRRGSDVPLASSTNGSRLPEGFEDHLAINAKLNATVSDTIARMKNLEQSNQSQ